MKKILFFFAFSLLLTSINLSAQFSGGNGTQADPFKITSRQNMEELADSVNNGGNWSKDKYFELMNDITDSIKTVIGMDYTTKSFQGYFNGAGKKINIALTGTENIGLFGCAIDATIENLSVEGYVLAAISVGGILGYGRNMNIENCNNYAKVSDGEGGGNFIGGIAGNCEGNFSKSNNYGEVTRNGRPTDYSGNFFAGGIVAICGDFINPVANNYVITNCNNYGKLYSHVWVGGIAGFTASAITNCNNYENINSYLGGGGGIAGWSCSDVLNCTNSADLNKTVGIVGRADASEQDASRLISNCINKGEISRGAGIAGGIDNVIISNCINTGNISATIIHNAIGQEQAITILAGIVGVVGISGEQTESIIINCTNTGNINYNAASRRVKSYRIGGILANDNGTIINCVNSGIVYGDYYVGGIAGYLGGNYNISNCTNIGSVIGTESVGGIVGKSWVLSSDSITNCVNSGAVYGNSYVGGIAGNFEQAPPAPVSANLRLENSINTGVILGRTSFDLRAAGYDFDDIINPDFELPIYISSSSTHNDGKIIYNSIGGIIGHASGITKIENCYYDKQMCSFGGIDGKDVEGQAEGKLTNEMIGTKLQPALKTITWTYNPDQYPIIKGFENDTICQLAAAPVYLNSADTADYDVHNNIRKNATASTQNGMNWSNTADKITVSGGNITIQNDGKDTLIANIGKYKKLIPVNINQYNQNHNHNELTNLTIEVDKDVFFPKTTNNGNITLSDVNNSRLITLENVVLPNMTADKDTVLLTIKGDVMFDKKGYSDVLPNNAKFSDEININRTNYTNGYLKLKEHSITIRASEQNRIPPNATDYEIPIYITASQYIAGLTIKKLVVDIDRNIFYPKSTDNGEIKLTNVNNICRMTFEDVAIPALEAEIEHLLMNIKGDVLLGNTDSCGIDIKEAEISAKINELNFINGYITIEICKEGGERLIDVLGYSPSIKVVKNPVNSMLDLECKTVEVGEHILTIVNIMGDKTEDKKWNVTQTGSHFFNYEIPITQYSEGTYTIIMKTPTAEYMDSFVIIK